MEWSGPQQKIKPVANAQIPRPTGSLPGGHGAGPVVSLKPLDFEGEHFYVFTYFLPTYPGE